MKNVLQKNNIGHEKLLSCLHFFKYDQALFGLCVINNPDKFEMYTKENQEIHFFF
jgi:hypothetical protein